MNNIYNATVDAVKKYTHAKQYTVLNVCASNDKTVEISNDTLSKTVEPVVEVVAEPVVEIVAEPVVEPVVVIDASTDLEEINPKEMKKSELIDYVKMTYGEDADVSGTKAEIIERYFA